jgi:hypothetical protein
MPMLTPFRRRAVDHPADKRHVTDVRFDCEERAARLHRYMSPMDFEMKAGLAKRVSTEPGTGQSKMWLDFEIAC